MQIHNDSFSCKKPFGRVRIVKEGWTDGDVVTPSGIVGVYAQGDKENYHMTRLDFVFNGKWHIRCFHGKRYSPRGLVTKANQFASEIVKEEQCQS